MPRIVTPAIPSKMYRHFALVTVLLTGVLALFADGENREAVAAHIEERAEENEVRRASHAKFGAPKLGGEAAARPRVPHGWDAGDDGGFGKPMERARGGAGSSFLPDGLLADAVEAVGYSPDYLASLSAEEREMLLKGLQDSGMLSGDVREERAATLAAASGRRSGAPSDE